MFFILTQFATLPDRGVLIKIGLCHIRTGIVLAADVLVQVKVRDARDSLLLDLIDFSLRQEIPSVALSRSP